MLCEPDYLMNIDDTFYNALGAVRRWRMEGQLLVLEGKSTRLILRPAEPFE